MSDWADEYMRMIEDCEKRESKLTDWERGFIDSIKHRLEDGHALTRKQLDTIDNIWDRVTR